MYTYHPSQINDFGDDPVASCKGDRVHDVQLGDAEGGAVASSSEASQPSGDASVASRTGTLTSGAESSGMRTPGARGALSYAAAALASAGVNGSRGGGRERKSLGAAMTSNSPPKLMFSLGRNQLNRMSTIFQAIQRQAVVEEDEEERYGGSEHGGGSGRRLWDEVYTITYQRADANGEASLCVSGKSAGASPRGKGCGSAMDGSWQQASLLDSTLQGELPCDLDKSNNSYSILLLLRVLEGLNRLAPRLRAQGAWEAFAAGEVDRVEESPGAGPLVPREEFLSSKLTPKLARQMQDALALCSGGLPSWCGQLTRACPFLFPFETRRQYFYSTAFGLSRALQRLQQQQNADGSAASNDRELRVGRLQRQKVRVSRQRILESAAKVMELYAGHKAVLEVEYFGEVGTGLGPTLEFYTLLSHELQKEKLNLWRSEMRLKSEATVGVESAEVDTMDADVEMVGEVEAVSTGESGRGSAEGEVSCIEYVTAPQGLFPRPWHPDTDPASNKNYWKVLEHFRLLGRVMAKALQDGRLLDVPLSTAFCKIILGQELDLYDMQTVDPDLGRTLFEMQGLIQRKQFLEGHGGKREEVEALNFRGSKLEDLCLDFTLPGYPEYELKSNGREVAVDLDNLEEYVSMVVEATVKVGIAAQIEAFRAGFNQVFPLSSLQIFSEDELDYLLCGRRELWAPESLPDIMKFDHGYTASSPPIRNLLDIMSELSPEDQRAFLRFVTGAPRLPPGGLAALNPKLTIVRKHPTDGSGVPLGSTPPGALAGLGTTLADKDLPSVMTCANYLKLPPYSCKEIMRKRLLYAIHEGQGSFDLS
uniref:HECT domain-containing protein n=1 Tax=Physcomitrium patens TaxID=3218 RepID=A0A7I4DP31_PHYPA